MTTVREIWTKMGDLEGVRDDMLKAGRSIWLAGLGAVAAADEGARGLFEDLVAEGKRLEGRRKTSADRAKREMDERLKMVRDRAAHGVHRVSTVVLHRFGVPTRSDIEKLAERLEHLTRRVHAIGAAG